MADQKISAMPSAEALTGAELIPLVQSGVNVQATLDTISAYDRSYGAWSDSTDQTGSVTAGTALTFNATDVSDGITLVNNSEITVPNTGVYNLQFSAQFKNTDNSQHDATIWISKNGTPLANTSTQFTVPARKSTNVYGYAVGTVTYLLELTADDYIEILWIPTSTLVTVEAIPASVSPAIPAVPSIIAVMLQVA